MRRGLPTSAAATIVRNSRTCAGSLGLRSLLSAAVAGRTRLGMSLCWAAAVLLVGHAELRGEQPVTAPPASVLPEDYSCTFCHSKAGDFWAEAVPTVEAADLAHDIHWQKGLRCHDCHGGSPAIAEFKNHRDDPDFRSVRPRSAIPAFCGHCHSSIEYMRRFNPSARTDQEAEYWTSGHGRRLKATAEEAADSTAPAPAGDAPGVEGEPEASLIDTDVATCVDCHGRHGILAVNDIQSKVFPTKVAETCSECHSDPQRMAGREYNGRPLLHNQYAEWRASVHGRALLEKGDLSAPSCNDCHGNHGALPPGVDSVANACGTCHGRVAKLFADTQMKHRFEESGLPGCATCHGNHRTLEPTDEMLGMDEGAVCANCHRAENLQLGATLLGADVARQMRQDLEQLKQGITRAEQTLHQAERLGMEVRGPRFELLQAVDALTNARTLVHTFKLEPVAEALAAGSVVAQRVQESGEAALKEHTGRRVWLAASLLPIMLVVALLVLYIRSLPAPKSEL